MLEEALTPQPPPRNPTNIRTMKSDVSQFLKDTKPSLIKLLSTQIEEERGAIRPRVSENKNIAGSIGLILIALVALGVLGAGGYFGYQYIKPAPPVQTNVLVPQALFAVDISETIQVDSVSAGTLTGKLQSVANSLAAGAGLKRLVILKADGSGTSRSISAEDFLKAAEINATALVSKTFTTPIMPVFYKASSGTRMGLIVGTDDPERVRAEFLSREPSIAFDWAAIYLNQKPQLAISTPYQDKIYRNISYRSVTFDVAGDNGIVYSIYPAKKYFIITSSEEMFKVIINRLYESG